MNNKSENFKNENIELSLPVNAAYVSAARLTASSIANRLNFFIDEIEDVKAAVSEACTYVIKKAPVTDGKLFKIIFVVQENSLSIRIVFDMALEIAPLEEEIGLLMIKALMDDLKLENDKSGFEIVMNKAHKKNDFEI